MRISGIEAYMGGSDNVSSFSLIQNEMRIFTGQWLTGSGLPVDIQSDRFEITANAEFYTVESCVVTSRKLTISGELTLLDNPALKPLKVEKVHGKIGEFKLTIPEDFFVEDVGEREPINIDADLSENVPMSIIYIHYADRSDSPDDIIRLSRMVVILRRGE